MMNMPEGDDCDQMELEKSKAKQLVFQNVKSLQPNAPTDATKLINNAFYLVHMTEIEQGHLKKNQFP